MRVKIEIPHVADYKIIISFSIDNFFNLRKHTGVNFLTNIIDGMDEARFQSGNVKANSSLQKKGKKEEKKMPMVLKNLKNGS